MKATRDQDGHIALERLTPLDADTLLRLPEWLASEDPEVKGRLFPDVYDDPEEAEQWRRLGTPELLHLFASRQELVKLDLATMEHVAPVRYRMRIAKGHEKAWLATLNAARLALFMQHRLGPKDMELDPCDADTEVKEIALMRIHVMAFVQELLLHV